MSNNNNNEEESLTIEQLLLLKKTNPSLVRELALLNLNGEFNEARDAIVNAVGFEPKDDFKKYITAVAAIAVVHKAMLEAAIHLKSGLDGEYLLRDIVTVVPELYGWDLSDVLRGRKLSPNA
jgi:Flp pilus assembly protein TadD